MGQVFELVIKKLGVFLEPQPALCADVLFSLNFTFFMFCEMTFEKPFVIKAFVAVIARKENFSAVVGLVSQNVLSEISFGLVMTIAFGAEEIVIAIAI